MKIEKYIEEYVGYAAWLLPSHPSVHFFIQFPHFCQTDWDRSGPDPGSSCSKRTTPVLQSLEEGN